MALVVQVQQELNLDQVGCLGFCVYCVSCESFSAADFVEDKKSGSLLKRNRT